MNNTNREKIDEYLASLEEALGRPGAQSAGILDEVRGDLETHVDRSVEKGLSEDEGVALAISEMGNPYELAHQMLREIPPFGGGVTTVVRYAAASAVILWTLALLWLMRPGVYGVHPILYVIVVMLHLPAILLIWPRIVWRKNYLFGLIPAGIALVVAMAFSFSGTRDTSIEIPLPPAGETLPAAQLPAIPLPEHQPEETRGIWVAVVLVLIGVILLMAMQRRSQRRAVIVAMLVGIGSIEAAFQGEEWIFRQDQENVRQFLEASFRENGSYPTEEAVRDAGPEVRSDHLMLRPNGDAFTMFWRRPLSRGHAIVYSSGDGKIRIQD